MDRMDRTRLGLVVGAAALGVIGVAGATLANAEETPTPAVSSTVDPDRGPGQGKAPRHEHTPVTGDELARVTEAVAAKDPAVTVTEVEKDADGSYDVHGTRAGEEVRLEVSADLATITEGKGKGKGKGHGHGKGPKDAGVEVTGADRTAVEGAAAARLPGLTVQEVRRRSDGSFVVKGTRAGAPVHVEVSGDLATVVERPGWGRGGRPDKGPDRTPSS